MKHVIPYNISSDGGIMGGAIKKRNAAEAAIYVVLCFIFFKTILFFVPIVPRIIAFTFVALIPGAVIIVGIADQSAVEYITTKLRYKRRKDIVPYRIQTESLIEEPKTILEKYERSKIAKEEKKAEKVMQRRKALEFDIANSTSPKKKKKLEKKLRKDIEGERKELQKAEEKAKRKAEKAAKKKDKKKEEPSPDESKKKKKRK